MAQVFGSSDDGITYPDLAGAYVPAIDSQQAENGLGLYVSWGGGTTAETTSIAGDTSTVGSTTSESTTPITGNTLTYDIEGLVGPQGAQGIQGDPGEITSITQQIFVPYGNTDLNEVLVQLKGWESGETIIYASDATIYWDTPWTALDVAEGVSTWFDSAMDGDGSFILIGSTSGAYVSTDTGGSWVPKNIQGSQAVLGVSVSSSGGKAVAVVDNYNDSGKIYLTSDGGANWSEVTVN